MEKWKAIENTNGLLEVSDAGRVRSWLRGTPYVLKAQSDKKGYLRLRVTINREKRSYKIHREVARAFLPNPQNLPQVNHIDGNKNNNCVNNLEWVTNKENANHAIKSGLWDTVYKGAMRENNSRKKPIVAYNDKETIYFESISDAERALNNRHITDVLKGKRQHASGYKFCYESEVVRRA